MTGYLPRGEGALLKIVCYLAHAFAGCRGNGVLMDTAVFINTLMC